MHEKEAICNCKYHYTTTRQMPKRKIWGTIELNPLMWLTVWKKQIAKFANNEYQDLLIDRSAEDNEPKQSTTLIGEDGVR